MEEENGHLSQLEIDLVEWDAWMVETEWFDDIATVGCKVDAFLVYAWIASGVIFKR